MGVACGGLIGSSHHVWPSNSVETIQKYETSGYPCCFFLSLVSKALEVWQYYYNNNDWVRKWAYEEGDISPPVLHGHTAAPGRCI